MTTPRPTTPRPGGYRLVAAEPDAHTDAELARSFAPSVRVPWVLVTTLITAIASVTGTYFATHSTAPTDTHAEYHALDTRVADLAASVDRLAASVARNADVAHNDTAGLGIELHAYVNAHAR